ncbi:MAG: hypothetical protein QOI01_3336 [Mycobacterium sp.]|nr:hypothetical protein [Mycobacterium sp.]
MTLSTPEPDDTRARNERPGQGIDTTVAHPARRYNYWLGGKDHFAADRASGDAIAAIFPHIRAAAVENRGFLDRTVRFLAAEYGIRQYLDIGTGLPAADNTHQIAQRIHSDARIVYVDNDPMVLAHARALLVGDPPGRTAYLQADLRRPEQILTSGEITSTLDLTQPVAVLLVAVLHFLPDDELAYSAVKTLMDAVPVGSYLVVSHATTDLLVPDIAARFAQLPSGGGDFTARTHDQVLQFFDRLELIEPGLLSVSNWRRDHDDPPPPPEQVCLWGGVARKPPPELGRP